MAENLWYYAHGEEQLGPVSSTDLKRLAETAELAPDDLVWREGMDDWAPAQRVKGLFPPREPAGGETAAERGAPPGPPLASSAGPPVAPPAPPPPPAMAAAVPTLPIAQPAVATTTPSISEPTSITEPPASLTFQQESLSPGLRAVLFGAQGILWATCVTVVILGGALFLLAMVEANKSKADQAATAQVSATLFIGAYVLARAGERACLLLEKFLTNRR